MMLDLLPLAVPGSLPQWATAIIGLAVGALLAYYKGNDAEAIKKYLAIEQRLRGELSDRVGLPSPETEKVGRGHIDEALQEAIPAYDGTDDPIKVVYTDGHYLAPKEIDLDRVILVSRMVDYFPYRPEVFDCEDYARFFHALTPLVAGTNAVGKVLDWSGNHSYNVIVTAEENVRFYDPNGPGFVEQGSEEKYTLRNGQIEV